MGCDAPSFLSDAVLYHDYRARHTSDLSGNDNDGTLERTVRWVGSGLHMGATGAVQVANDSTLQNAEGTLIVFGKNFRSYSSAVLIAKRVFSTEWYLGNSDQNHIIFYDGASSSVRSFDFTNKTCIAANYKSGTKPEFYADGILIGNGDINIAISSTTDPITVGSFRNPGISVSRALYEAALIFPRKLTAAEHAELFEYLSDRQYETNPDVACIKPHVLYHTGFGVFTSQDTTTGQLSNSLFEVISGTHKITESNGTKSINCVGTGVLAARTISMHHSATEAAYGTWEFSTTGAASTMIIATVAGAYNAAAQNGYQVEIDAAGALKLQRITSGAVASTLMTTANATISLTARTRIVVTRSNTGVFTVYADDTKLTAATGSNPATDATYTTSDYICLVPATNTLYTYCDKCGGNTITKRLIVVPPE